MLLPSLFQDQRQESSGLKERQVELDFHTLTLINSSLGLKAFPDDFLVTTLQRRDHSLLLRTVSNRAFKNFKVARLSWL